MWLPQMKMMVFAVCLLHTFVHLDQKTSQRFSVWISRPTDLEDSGSTPRCTVRRYRGHAELLHTMHLNRKPDGRHLPQHLEASPAAFKDLLIETPPRPTVSEAGAA